MRKRLFVLVVVLVLAVAASTHARAYTGNELPGPVDYWHYIKPIGAWCHKLIFDHELGLPGISIIFNKGVHIYRGAVAAGAAA